MVNVDKRVADLQEHFKTHNKSQMLKAHTAKVHSVGK